MPGHSFLDQSDFFGRPPDIPKMRFCLSGYVCQTDLVHRARWAGAVAGFLPGGGIDLKAAHARERAGATRLWPPAFGAAAGCPSASRPSRAPPLPAAETDRQIRSGPQLTTCWSSTSKAEDGTQRTSLHLRSRWNPMTWFASSWAVPHGLRSPRTLTDVHGREG